MGSFLEIQFSQPTQLSSILIAIQQTKIDLHLHRHWQILHDLREVFLNKKDLFFQIHPCRLGLMMVSKVATVSFSKS